MTIRTARLLLRPWRGGDLDAFAALHADPEVMADAGGVLDRAQSEAKLRRYVGVFERHGYTRWALQREDDGEFLGYCGMTPTPAAFPIAPGVEIGWRLRRSAWGHGYATEAACAAINDGFRQWGFEEVIAFTAPTNQRSQAVMERLGLTRQAHRDFEIEAQDGRGRWLVWQAARPL